MLVDDVYHLYLDTGLVLCYKIVAIMHGGLGEMGYVELHPMGGAWKVLDNAPLNVPMRLFEAMITSKVLILAKEGNR